MLYAFTARGYGLHFHLTEQNMSIDFYSNGTCSLDSDSSNSTTRVFILIFTSFFYDRLANRVA